MQIIIPSFWCNLHVYVTLFCILHVDTLGMEDFTSSQSWLVILVYKLIGKTNIQLYLKTLLLMHVNACSCTRYTHKFCEIMNQRSIFYSLKKQQQWFGRKENFVIIKYSFWCLKFFYRIVVFKDMIHTAKSSPKSIMTLIRCIQYEETLLKRPPKEKNMEWC